MKKPTPLTALSRRRFLQDTGAALAGMTSTGCLLAATSQKDWLAKPVEIDPDSGAEIFQLTDDERPTDDLYGEQPYSPPEGNRIAIEHATWNHLKGGISILDLTDGSLHPVLNAKSGLPAFHAWGVYLYYKEVRGDRLILNRCRFQTLAKEEALELPKMEGNFSYGAVSQDHRYYAVSFYPKEGGSKVLLFDLKTGQQRTLVQRTDYWFKHEQFSRDGRNRVLIQANKLPDVKEVHLGALEVDREGVRWFPADQPHTPRPTGHEAWVGNSERIFFSTAKDKTKTHQGNLWTAALGDAEPSLACKTPTCFTHVSVSRCGRFWIGETGPEKERPIHIGSFNSGRHRRAVFSRTVHDGKQWSHTHHYLTADNRWLIFNSTRSGRAQVYGARLAKGFLENL